MDLTNVELALYVATQSCDLPPELREQFGTPSMKRLMNLYNYFRSTPQITESESIESPRNRQEILLITLRHAVEHKPIIKLQQNHFRLRGPCLQIVIIAKPQELGLVAPQLVLNNPNTLHCCTRVNTVSTIIAYYETPTKNDTHYYVEAEYRIRTVLGQYCSSFPCSVDKKDWQIGFKGLGLGLTKSRKRAC